MYMYAWIVIRRSILGWKSIVVNMFLKKVKQNRNVNILWALKKTTCTSWNLLKTISPLRTNIVLNKTILVNKPYQSSSWMKQKIIYMQHLIKYEVFKRYIMHLSIVHETQYILSYKVVIHISQVILNMEKKHEYTYWTHCDWKKFKRAFVWLVEKIYVRKGVYLHDNMLIFSIKVRGLFMNVHRTSYLLISCRKAPEAIILKNTLGKRSLMPYPIFY